MNKLIFCFDTRGHIDPGLDTTCWIYYASPFWHLPTICRMGTLRYRSNTPENIASYIHNACRFSSLAWTLFCNTLIIPHQAVSQINLKCSQHRVQPAVYRIPPRRRERIKKRCSIQPNARKRRPILWIFSEGRDMVLCFIDLTRWKNAWEIFQRIVRRR